MNSCAPERSRIVTISAMSASDGLGPRRTAPPGARGPPASACWNAYSTGRVFLWRAMSDRHLAGLLLLAPDPEQVVVELEGEAQRPAEAAVAARSRPRRRSPAGRRPRWRRRSARPSCGRSCRSRARPSSARPDADVAMSMYWPSHRRTHVSSYRRISRRTLLSEKPRSVSRWSATRLRLKIRSPVLMAWGTPWIAHRVARWRRSTSPSSMSSWTRLKLWPSSTAAAPGRARVCSPAIEA